MRGGPGSSASLPIIDDPSQVPPDRVQEGISSNCTRYIVANSTSASCWKLANDAKIRLPRLWELNPVLGQNGENCGTMVWLGYYYCIATNGEGDPGPTPTISSSTTASSTTTGVPKPTKTQDGIDPNCNKFTTGDSCWAIANAAGIDLAQLYKWNTVLGENGENCETQIWPGYYYCIGISTSTTEPPPSTTTSAPQPTKTQDGFPANCKKYVQAKSGDTCWSISNDNGIGLEQLYNLNPILGPDGENCGTQIWPEYYYCLAT